MTDVLPTLAGIVLALPFQYALWRGISKGQTWAFVLIVAVGVPMAVVAVLGIFALGIWKLTEIL